MTDAIAHITEVTINAHRAVFANLRMAFAMKYCSDEDSNHSDFGNQLVWDPRRSRLEVWFGSSLRELQREGRS